MISMSISPTLYRFFYHLSTYLSIALWLLFAWLLISFLQQAATLGDIGAVIDKAITFAWQSILLLGMVGVIHGVERSIDREFENTRSKLIGLVIAHDNITISELATKMGMSVSDVETLISLVNAEGLAEIKVDARTGIVTVAKAKKEKGGKEEFLSRLEKLHEEGYISDEAYSRLKKEYEKK